MTDQSKKTDDTVKPVTDEDLASQISESTEPEALGIVTLMGMTQDDLNKLVKGRIEKESPRKFTITVRDQPESYDSLVWFSALNTSSEVARAEDALAKLSPEEKKEFEYRLEKDGKVLLGPGMVEATLSDAKQVTGKAGALKLLGARAGRFRRFPLYNSGCSVDLRVPTLDELGALVRNCNLDMDEYGRRWGASYYMYYSFILMQNFVDMFMGLIVTSSVKGFTKPGVLLNTIRLPDVNPIFAYVASLMYPKGYPNFRHFCSRPRDKAYPDGCDHVETLTVDVMKMAKTKFSCMSAQAVTHMAKARLPDAAFTPEELAMYEASLGFDGKTIDFDGFTFFLCVPTLADYITCGSVFNEELTREVNLGDEVAVASAVATKELRMYLPWIKRIVAYDDDGNEAGFIEDRDGMVVILDQVMENPEYTTQLRDKLIDYINDSQLTHIGYPTFSCPKCGHVPNIPSGFFTVDMIGSFFTMLLPKYIRS